MIPEIGTFVLFCINESPDAWRPMLVVSTKDALISGVLYLDPGQDRSTTWAMRLFHGIDFNAPWEWVANVSAGRRLGNYRPLPAPALHGKSKIIPLAKARGVAK